jgi:hypothetical protein
MRKLIVSEFVSLDGVIQAPGGKDEDPDCGFGRGKGIWTDDAPQGFTLKSATPYATGVVGLDYVRQR